jgi:hypothetical protein
VTTGYKESTREEQDQIDHIISEVLELFSSEEDEYDTYQACEDNYSTTDESFPFTTSSALYPKVPNPSEQCSSKQREEDAEVKRNVEEECSHQVSLQCDRFDPSCSQNRGRLCWQPKQ